MLQLNGSLESILSKIDKFADEKNKERLCFLAGAVVPYGMVEDEKGVPDLFQSLQKKECEHAVELLQRMLSKAGFKPKHVSLLDEHITVPKFNFQQFPDMLFRESLISVADQLGDGKYLTALVNMIPEDKIGVAKSNIKSAVHLFQRLVHEQTISADNQSTLNDFAQWLQGIGRKDIAKNFSGTAAQEQGLPQF